MDAIHLSGSTAVAEQPSDVPLGGQPIGCRYCGAPYRPIGKLAACTNPALHTLWDAASETTTRHADEGTLDRYYAGIDAGIAARIAAELSPVLAGRATYGLPQMARAGR